MALNIAAGTYNAQPTQARIYTNQSGNLILEVRFVLCDENWEHYVGDNGYAIDMRKWFVLVKADGTVNTATISRLKEWADGFAPSSLDDFYEYWTGAGFSHLAGIKVQVVVQLTAQGQYAGRPEIAFVNSLSRKGTANAALPQGADDDRAKIAARFGAKFRAAFAATPKVVSAAPARPAAPAPAPQTAPQTAAPSAPPRPARPAANAPAPAAKPVTEADCWNAYCARLPEGTDNSTRDAGWFEVLDRAGVGDRDPDQITPAEWAKVLEAANNAEMPF